MDNPNLLLDADARVIAETTFDRNVVVLAGAGTGKTTLLVNRLIHALLREPHPLRLTDMLALTFTNKAADEMKSRLRERLHGILADCETDVGSGKEGTQYLDQFRHRYQVSTEHIREKTQIALGDLEKAQIATLHSFAAHILRLYPLESRSDPNFQEDEGNHFLEMFQEEWNGWLEQELGAQGPGHAQWEEVLNHMVLKEIRAFAFSLCQDLISNSELEKQVGSEALPQAFAVWLQTKQQQVRALLLQYDRSKPRKIERLVALAGHVFDHVGQPGWQGVSPLTESDRALFDSIVGKAPGEWNHADFQEAKRAIQAAHRLLQVNETVLRKVLRLLEPFVGRVRQIFADKGWIRFDGMLVRVRDLLRDHPLVREQLKGMYQAVMVDELQDTDPIQYEILLYLGERPGEHSRSWRDMRLVPGKLFIVGDPKQSIYAFRRADIEAFDQVVNKLSQEGGIVCTLLTNFRSDGSILEVVNAVFNRLFISQANVQPANVPLAVGRTREAGVSKTGVELWVMANSHEEEEWDAERATRTEAEWLAGWIGEQLRHGTHFIVERGVKSPLCPGHIAVLFRKFTNAQVYLEAFQRHGIPYMTDGERHFYRRQEVVDFVNVLRVLDDPADAIGLVGVLRSSLGGLTDQEIMEIARLGGLDIRRSHMLAEWESSHRFLIQSLFQRLALLHARANRLPIPELLDHLFDQLPIVELAAASSHGEQAVVNVWKLRDLMSEQAAVPHLSFSACVDRLVDSMMTHPSEPEAPLAEDTLAAVRVLTIHKAKGLEFPLVVLPGLHQKAAGPDRKADITFDWISGLYGCTLPPLWNAAQVPLWEKQQIREDAEQRRVLYVGMTRARDRLILSGGILPKRGGHNLFGLLQQIAEGEFGNPAHSLVRVGAVSIPQTVVTPNLLKTGHSSLSQSHTDGDVAVGSSSPQLSERESRWRQANQIAAHVTPSLLHQERKVQDVGESPPVPQALSQRLGTLMHQLLQRWDFQCDPENARSYLADFCQRQLSCELKDGDKDLAKDLETLFHEFLHSSAYRELQRSTIIGREVPFAIPWPTGGKGHSVPETCVMEGVMDVVYELDGEIWVGDYKTDQVSPGTMAMRAEGYRDQAYAYAIGASLSLGPVVKGCKLFFIRSGKIVPVILQADYNSGS